MTSDDRPLVILQPAPQRPERIFTPAAREDLESSFRVVDLSDDHDPGSFDEVLPEAFAIIGQPDLPAERLARATELRAICNVEGNFFPNVDYDGAFSRGIQVLGCGPAYAQAVAEYALGPRPGCGPRDQSGGSRVPVRHRAVRAGRATPTPSCCAAPGSV